MTILITGTARHSGRHLVQTLAAKGAPVRTLTRDPAKAEVPQASRWPRAPVLISPRCGARFRGRPVIYGGDDPAGFERNLGRFMAPCAAYEVRLMVERYVADGMIPAAGDGGRLTAMPGRPLFSYRETAEALAAATA